MLNQEWVIRMESFNDYFSSLFKKLGEKLEYMDEHNEIPDNDSERSLEHEIEAFHHLSEQILDQWIQFDETLAKVMHKFQNHISEHHQGTDEHSETSAEQSVQRKVKGNAFYDLLMFEQAIEQYEHWLVIEPDDSRVRFFLSQALIAAHKADLARYHLHFLIETAEQDEMKQLAFHALGCMEGTLRKYNKADHYFHKIDVHGLQLTWKSIYLYNHALTKYLLNEYESCLLLLKDYLSIESNDWKGMFLAGKAYHGLGERAQGMACWFEALQIQENQVLLKQMARYFGQCSLDQMALRCYERIIHLDGRSKDAEVWFGLAWHSGQLGNKEQSQQTFQRALSLFPDHEHMQISYVWMLLTWREWNKARRMIEKLQSKHYSNPLVQGLVLLENGQWNQALQKIDKS